MNEQPPRPISTLDTLGILVGKWAMVGTHPAFPSAVHGSSTFKWLLDGTLLVWHFDWERPGPPSAVSVIGRDDPAETYTMLYGDERGVGRIYEMTLVNETWKMWRPSPGFSQRMTGRFSDDGNTIVVRGQLSRDGANWDADLNVTYTRE